MPGTPLSDRMDLAGSSDDHYREFLREFGRSKLGVLAQRSPFSVGLIKGPDGGKVILAFADPPAFIQRFGQKFNAEMAGVDLLKTALANPDCQGVLVNSAKQEISVLIQRRTAQQLLGADQAPAPSARPWWKFW